MVTDKSVIIFLLLNSKYYFWLLLIPFTYLFLFLVINRAVRLWSLLVPNTSIFIILVLNWSVHIWYLLVPENMYLYLWYPIEQCILDIFGPRYLCGIQLISSSLITSGPRYLCISSRKRLFRYPSFWYQVYSEVYCWLVLVGNPYLDSWYSEPCSLSFLHSEPKSTQKFLID